MTAARRLLGLILLLAPGTGWARPERGLLAVEQRRKVSLQIQRLTGAAPEGLPDLGPLGGALSLRGSDVGGKSYLGSGVGAEYLLALELAEPEVPALRKGVLLGFTGGLWLALAAYRFDVPADGLLTLRVGGEVGLGGGRWWSDGPRFAFSGGARLALRWAEQWRLELDYELVPHVFTSAPSDWTVRRTEHRARLSLGVDTLGPVLAVQYGETRRERGGAWERLGSLALVLGIEWRWP